MADYLDGFNAGYKKALEVMAATSAPTPVPHVVLKRTRTPKATPAAPLPVTAAAPAAPAPRKRSASESPTKWVADRNARRVPKFVIEMTGGLDTKKKIVAEFGENAAFEKGKPLPHTVAA